MRLPIALLALFCLPALADESVPEPAAMMPAPAAQPASVPLAPMTSASRARTHWRSRKEALAMFDLFFQFRLRRIVRNFYMNLDDTSTVRHRNFK